jgi:hypothetical protein
MHLHRWAAHQSINAASRGYSYVSESLTSHGKGDDPGMRFEIGDPVDEIIEDRSLGYEEAVRSFSRCAVRPERYSLT